MTRCLFRFDAHHPLLQKEYEDDCNTCIQELDVIFSQRPKQIRCNIFFDADSFKKCATENGQENVVAFIPQNSTNTIFVMHSPHMQSGIRRSIIKHELSHLYINCFNKNLPDVLKEGVAVYVSEQLFASKKNIAAFQNFATKKIIDVHALQAEWQKLEPGVKYYVAGSVVRQLVRQHTWEGLLKLLAKNTKSVI